MVLLRLQQRKRGFQLTLLVVLLCAFGSGSRSRSFAFSQRSSSSSSSSNSSSNNSSSSNSSSISGSNSSGAVAEAVRTLQQQLAQTNHSTVTAQQSVKENSDTAEATDSAAATATEAAQSQTAVNASLISALPPSLILHQSSDEIENEESNNSAEILNVAEDAAVHSNVAATTYRPSARPSIAPHNSAQERERKLMNVLAARRNALHRGNFRTRVGTTGRTATAASSIESTSKSPTDARSICIRNCTKNFTRRTTASCMRQCANFSRSALAAAAANATATASAAAAAAATIGAATGAAGSMIIVRPASKTGLGTQTGERDTNEILFTDESSHGLFVVAKDQNDTLNHIPDAAKSASNAKFRARTKLQPTATLAPSSIEEDDISPYLYFGQKLPPIKPSSLNITAVSDEHPKLLEVSVAQLGTTTTPTPSVSRANNTSTLSPVERSRSRYKYRDRSYMTINRRIPNRSSAATVALGLKTDALTQTKLTAEALEEELPTLAKHNETQVDQQVEITQDKKNIIPESATAAPVVAALREAEIAPTESSAQLLASSTPLIITVLGEEEDFASTLMTTPAATQINTTLGTTTTTATSAPTSTTTEQMPSPPATTTNTARTTTTTMTTTTTTTTTTPRPTRATTIRTPYARPSYPTTLRAYTSTARITTTPTTSSTTTPSALITSTTTTTTTTTTATPLTSTTPGRKSMIDEDTEKLRALMPSLVHDGSNDGETNLVIFVNHTSTRPSSTLRPPTWLQRHSTTDASTSILRTTVLTSVRSTVHPRTQTFDEGSNNNNGDESAYVGIIESSAPLDESTVHTTAASGATTDADETADALEKRRVNIATMVLAGIGIIPLCALILYLVRSHFVRRHTKHEEEFDVCITDQQPISPVKKLDSKQRNNRIEDDDDEVDHHQTHTPSQHHVITHHMPLTQSKSTVTVTSARDANHNNRYDEQCSVTSDQEFERSNIRLKSLLGEGNFGQVWKAEADDLSGHFGATRIVAVKTIRACSAQMSLKDEANIMRKLGSHPNVVTLLGACVESEPHMLIMEYAMRGRLLSLLRAARSATNILPASVPGGRSLAPLSPRTLAGFALDIACGMEYIAEKRIVHRDLAARNVLLDHNGVCKICDFGMSIDLDAERKRKEAEKNCANEIMRSNSNKFKFDFGSRFIMQHWHSNFGDGGGGNQQQQKEAHEKKHAHSNSNGHGHGQGHNHHGHVHGNGHGNGHGHGHGHDTISRRPALPIRWMAPEALQYHIFSRETDVWAFGIVLWELATLGSTPYSTLTGREVIRRVPNGLRPELPKEGRHEFYNLMTRCWHKDPHMRPSFTHARQEITRSLHKWVDDDSAASDYMDVSGFSEDLEHGMVYFNHRISEFECEI